MKTSRNGDHWQRVKGLLDQALDLPTAERQTFLDSACEGDQTLLGQVHDLLERQERLGGFLSRPVFTLRQTEGDERGRRIGPYRLLQQIGSGGMGAVYLAEREDGQLRQRVAVKILKKGLDTEEIVHRFQRERQILADLAHPNVARLLDGGSTDDGRPFFVMEHVAGLPIDTYCDRYRFGTRQRVALFRQVCAAVHFAHQNLVVHRDLKPANILVTEDGTPKLLDFGIAKLLSTSSHAPTLTTVPSPGPMTLPYASPEQLNGGVVTTATDTYVLGFLLYEILTGHRPYQIENLSPQGLAGILQEPPAKPSTMVLRTEEVELGDGDLRKLTPESVSQVRDGDPKRLARRLRGDLDNIVLKAMQFEPERRFSSVEQLSEDLRCHLEGLPVRSRPDTFLYRSGRFLRRHAVATTTIVLASTLLIGFTAVMGLQRQTIATQNQQISRERDLAETAFRLVETVARGREVTVQHIEEELPDEPKLQARLMDVLGVVYMRSAAYEIARPLLETALKLRRQELGAGHLLTAESLNNLAVLERDVDDLEQAEKLARQAIEIQRRELREPHKDLAVGLINLASLLQRKASRQDDEGLLEEAAELAREGLEMHEALLGSESFDVAADRLILATILREQGQLEEAERLYRRNLAVLKELGDVAIYQYASGLNSLGRLLVKRGDLQAAEVLYKEALDIRRELYTGAHPSLIYILGNLGEVSLLRGKPSLAIEWLEKGLAMALRLEIEDPDILSPLKENLVHAREEAGLGAPVVPVLQ